MSVFTLFLLLAICFTSIVVSAPNERANRLLKPIQAKFQSDVSVQSVSRSKSASDESSTASPIATSIYGSSVDIPTSWSALLPFASPTATGPTSINSSTSNPNNAGNSNGTPATSIALSYSGPGVSPMSSSISNLGAASVSSGLQPYPSQGAPYQNVSSPIGEPAGYNSSDTVGSGSNCSSVQTVTLPPVTVTLPAITVTMTASPETTTSTITTTITAGPVAACTSAMGSLFAGQGVAQTNLPNTFGLNATAAGSAAQSGSVGSGFPGQGATQSNIPSAPGLNATSAGSAAQSGSAGSAEPSQDVTQPGTSDIPGSNASAAGSVPPVSTGLNTQGAETEANELPSQTPGGGSATTSTPPSYFSIPASLASQLDRIPLYSLTPAGSPIVPAYSYAQSSSSAAAAQMNSGPPPSITPTGGSPLQTTPFVSPPYVAPYQNATGAGGVAAPSGAGTISGVVPAASGSPGPTGGPTAPPHQSLLLYQINGSFVPEPTAKASPPAGVNYTNTAPSINLGPVQPFTGAPAGPTLPPIPSLNDSNPQAPPLSPFSTNSQCSINNTSTQNLTTNVCRFIPFLFHINHDRNKC